MRLNKTEPPAYHETERSTLAVFVFCAGNPNRGSVIVICGSPVNIFGVTGGAGPIAFLVIAIFPWRCVRRIAKITATVDAVVFHRDTPFRFSLLDMVDHADLGMSYPEEGLLRSAL